MRWLTLPALVLLLLGLAYALWPRPMPIPGSALDARALAAALAKQSPGASLDADAPAAAASSATQAPSVGLDALGRPTDQGLIPEAQTELWELSAILRDEHDDPLWVHLTLARLALSAPRSTTPGPSASSASGGADGVTDTPADRPADSVAAEASARAALAPGADAFDSRRASALAADQIIVGQLRIVGELARPPLRRQRVSRAALGLAGAEPGPDSGYRIWLEHWQLERTEQGGWQLRASTDAMDLLLSLNPAKPLVLFDTAGFESPGTPSEALNLSAETRLMAAGTLSIDGKPTAISGTAWLEHAWGSAEAALSGGRGQLVANRFRLQLDNREELSCLHLRRRSGGGTPIPSCALITVDAESVTLGRRELSLAPLPQAWTAANGTLYPSHWRLVIPGRELELEIEPLMGDGLGDAEPVASGTSQAGARLAATALVDDAWSAAVRVSGWRGEDAISGYGQMDLSGYERQGSN